MVCEGLPRAMPICISPELSDSGVNTLDGIGDGIGMTDGLS